MRYGLECLVKDAHMAMQCPLAIDVCGCTDFIGYALERYLFAVQLASVILEIMHPGIIAANAG